MSPSVANSLDIAVGVLALCGLLIFEQVSLAFQPPRRHLRSLLINIGGAAVGVLPEVLSGQWTTLGGMAAAPVLGLILWIGWEMNYWRWELLRRWRVGEQRAASQR